MDNRFLRTRMLIGESCFERLKKSTVMIFGLGGVGGYAAEAIARSGVGHIILVDNDVISISNINRQILALSSTVGKHKTELMKERIALINPEAVVEIHTIFYLPQNSDIIKGNIDYFVDAVDTVSAKISIVERSSQMGIPVISSMGTGFKLNPSMLEVSDIYKTSVCPLAKVMRHELKKRGIKKLKVVYSKEKPIEPEFTADEGNPRKKTTASCAFVPPAAGLLIASEVIKDIAGIQ